jgi:hypothetical protein
LKLWHTLKKSVLFLGILVLGCNLAISSVPRCDVLFSIWNDARERLSEPAPAGFSCHEATAPEPATGPAIEDFSLCQCTLLSCLAFTLPSFEPESYIAFVPANERQLLFPWSGLIADHIKDLEAPPPRV